MPEAPRAEYLLGTLEGPVRNRLKGLAAERWPERIHQRDPSLWGDAASETIQHRLGWLTAADQLREGLGPVKRFVDKVRDDGFARVVVLGMGGSSLAAACLTRIFGIRDGYPHLTVLDSVAPAAIRDHEADLPLGKTLFVVSSKSGQTLETGALYAYFRERVRSAGHRSPGSH